jgi:beta-aspartyl-peptidase (threonine type)
VARRIDSTTTEVVIVYGGVDILVTAAYQTAVDRAALAGAARLSTTPVHAVESAITVMEDDPAFDSGTGAVLNRDGVVELDALIIGGTTGRAGAVAAIQNVMNRISVARKVSEATSYVLLAGDGAGAFAQEQGFPRADCSSPERQEARKRMNDAGSLSEIGLNPFTGQPDITRPSDSIGCVTNSRKGTATGVSTGGLFFKAPGRVGDSAIVGAGAFASPAGAVAGTGLGEAFHELLLCRRVGQLLEMGVHPQLAVEEAISFLHQQRDGVGGIIAVDSNGRIGIAHNGKSQAVAAVIDGELRPVVANWVMAERP